MSWWNRVGAWVGAVARRSRMESEMDAEMRFHVEAYAEDLARGGMARTEALRRARVEFGGMEQAKEECRDARGVSFVESVVQDLRFGLRMLRKSPGFTVTAVLTLALGIGANTAIFSVVNTVLLRPLPYKDADRLVMVWSYNRGRGYDTDQVSPLDFSDWRSQNDVFEGMAASTDAQYTLTGQGEPALITAYSFSADYFRVLGVAPLIGRTFLPEEEEAGKNLVVVLSYSFWKKRFGGDSGVVGKTIVLDGAAYTVAGVMPPGFQYPGQTELWTPLTAIPEAALDRGYRYLRVIARLKPGVSLQQARREMNAVAGRLAVEYPKTNKDDDATNLVSLREEISGDIRPALLVLLAAVGFVFLIACANIANLLLARAAGRQKEVAVRGALGASRRRLLRQFLTESVLLGLAGGALGLVFASWCTKALMSMFPPTIANLSIPRLEEIPMDGWVLAFAVGVSMLAGVVFGLAPALRASSKTTEALKESSGGLAGGIEGRRFRSMLVVVELGLSLMLVAAAGLTLKSFVHLMGSDLGFNPDRVLTLRVLPPSYKYKTGEQRIAFSDQALSGIRSVPGVKAAGTVTFLPLSGWWGVRGVSVVGQSVPENERPIVPWNSATPDYFRAMGVPLIRGRFFEEHDNQNGATVAIISKSLAQRLMPNADPVGKRLEVDGVKGAVEVVGVVGDVSQLGVTSQTIAGIYLPFAQLPSPILCFAIRTTGDPSGVAKAAEQAIWSVDEDQAVSYVMSMDKLVSESIAPQRILMLVLGAFGGMALLMAAIGIYGVIASSVAQQTHEIGVRMALGAKREDVLRLVLGQGLGLVVIGLAIGVAGTFALMRFVSSVLYGVRPTDPTTLAAAMFVLAATAVLACWIPARRATRVEPMAALRYE